MTIIEAYSLAEAGEVLRGHQPVKAVIDLRRTLPVARDRAVALASEQRDCHFVFVMNSAEARGWSPDPSLGNHLTVYIADPNDSDPSEKITHLVMDPSAVVADTPPPTPMPEQTRRQEARPTVPPPIEDSNPTSAGPAAETPTSPEIAEDAESEEDERRRPMVERYRTRTPALRQMLERLQIAARHKVTILLIGETGAGKTHLARLIHEASPCRDEPFIHVACGALPGELIESELFGHVKGAFTSAHADKDGKFLAAGKGTILLDEIDVLTPEQQVKLLRVIEKGEFEPVGSNDTKHVQARIIAASNLKLQPLVEEGRFRPDLYYRLNTLSFMIPPLRKRLPDVEPLARYFVHLHADRLGIELLNIDPDFLEALVAYPWPGNVREMENAIRSAVIYSEHGVLTANALPPNIRAGAAGPGNDPSVRSFQAAKNGESLEGQIQLTEKEIIEQALLTNNFSRTRTAKDLGISRVTLYNKMKKYGIM